MTVIIKDIRDLLRKLPLSADIVLFFIRKRVGVSQKVLTLTGITVQGDLRVAKSPYEKIKGRKGTENMSHNTKITDMDPLFVIDPITRAITKESGSKTTVIQYDHNSEKFTFSLPRIVEGHDMTECNRVEVHYLTTNGNTGVYEVTDLKVYPEDDSLVVCTWLLSQNATADTGVLSFLVRFSCVAEDGTIEYAWNTSIYAGISVQRGLYNAEAIVEENADILEQWYSRLFSLSDEGVSNVNTARAKALSDITTAKNTALNEIETASELIPDDYSALVNEVNQVVIDSVNLFNKNNVVEGSYKGNGDYFTTGGQRNEDYIPIETGIAYSWTPNVLLMINTYDENKTPIERLITYSAEIPRYTSYIFDNNVKFVRLSIYNKLFPDNFMFVKGDECPTVYEEFGIKKIKTEVVKPFDALYNNIKCAWFGDSISTLELLPHRVGDMTNMSITDCSFAGGPLTYCAIENLNPLGFMKLTESVVSGDFTEQENAISALGESAKRRESIENLKSLDFNNIDMVVVLAGTNDFGADITETNFKTGFITALERIMTAFPHLMIYVISPIWRGDQLKNYSGKTLADYVEWEKTVCETYNIPFLDLYHSCNINSLTMSKWLGSDQLHQTVDGDIMLAKKCAKFLLSN